MLLRYVNRCIEKATVVILKFRKQIFGVALNYGIWILCHFTLQRKSFILHNANGEDFFRRITLFLILDNFLIMT